MGLPPAALANVERFRYRKIGDHYANPSGRELKFVKTTYIPVSATEIRRAARQGKSIRYLVPLEVSDYIARHRLYQRG
jgi:nicotinic acid mononucleotide adenylyltransferase